MRELMQALFERYQRDRGAAAGGWEIGQHCVPFCSVELWINSPEEDESGMPKSAFRILNFVWDEIQEEGLAERAAAAAEATEAYYRGA